MRGTPLFSEFVHFGLTSQDINNTSQPLMMRDAINEVWAPQLLAVIERIEEQAEEWREVLMLARTRLASIAHDAGQGDEGFCLPPSSASTMPYWQYRRV